MLYGGVAAVAAAAGVGGAWWRERSGAAGGEMLDATFWAQRFERPEGGELVPVSYTHLTLPTKRIV